MFYKSRIRLESGRKGYKISYEQIEPANLSKGFWRQNIVTLDYNQFSPFCLFEVFIQPVLQS